MPGSCTLKCSWNAKSKLNWTKKKKITAEHFKHNIYTCSLNQLFVQRSFISTILCNWNSAIVAPKVQTPTGVAPIITSPVKPCYAMQSEKLHLKEPERDGDEERASERQRAGKNGVTTTVAAVMKNQKEKNQSYYYFADQSSFRLHLLSIHIIIRLLCSYPTETDGDLKCIFHSEKIITRKKTREKYSFFLFNVFTCVRVVCLIKDYAHSRFNVWFITDKQQSCSQYLGPWSITQFCF